MDLQMTIVISGTFHVLMRLDRSVVSISHFCCSYVMMLQCWQEDAAARPTFRALAGQLETAMQDSEETKL